VLERLALLKYRNARGSHIYIRPSDEHRLPYLPISARPRLRGSPMTASIRTTRITAVPAPAAADIAFCVAAYANGMTEDRIERALEDDYLSRDPSISKRAAYVRRTMELPALVSTTAQGFARLILS